MTNSIKSLGKLFGGSLKKKEDLGDTYLKRMLTSTDRKVYAISPEKILFNKNFPKLKKWAKTYLGAATAEFHDLDASNSDEIQAIRDENRNVIIPGSNTKIEGRLYYLAVKGCGAYEDMYFKGLLTHDSLIGACRDPSLYPKIKALKSTVGFIMSETWMGESPYGAQGEDNGLDELEFSRLAKPLSINGAYLCPLIALVQLPSKIEDTARKFFWCRTYPRPFYQSIRLVPSRARLYFESDQTANDPGHLMEIFGIRDAAELEDFEANFIRSGLALLSLFMRSAEVSGENVKGLVYIDVWMDKDAIIAPDGVIHFADLEGLDFQMVQKSEYPTLLRKEWDKLAFEYLYALVNIDTHRRKLEGVTDNFRHQRDDLAMQVQRALELDPFANTLIKDGDLYIVLDFPSLPAVEIPFLEKIS